MPSARTPRSQSSKSTCSDSPWCQITVALEWIEPTIWRRIVVPTCATLEDLHYYFQDAFGWENAHLHQFNIGGHVYGVIRRSNDPAASEDNTEDERTITIAQVVSSGVMHFSYEYDFGDCWLHDVVIEDKAAQMPTGGVPVCIDGARACPPEDVGGPPGYEHYIEAYFDPDHEDHEEMVGWRGKGFDPERFTIKNVNSHLRTQFTKTLTERAMAESIKLAKKAVARKPRKVWRPTM